MLWRRCISGTKSCTKRRIGYWGNAISMSTITAVRTARTARSQQERMFPGARLAGCWDHRKCAGSLRIRWTAKVIWVRVTGVVGNWNRRVRHWVRRVRDLGREVLRSTRIILNIRDNSSSSGSSSTSSRTRVFDSIRVIWNRYSKKMTKKRKKGAASKTSSMRTSKRKLILRRWS